MGETKLSLEGLKHHLDNIEHSTKMYKAYGFEEHAYSVKLSKQIVMNAFKELKGERL